MPPGKTLDAVLTRLLLCTSLLVTMTEATVYHKLQDLRLLARRDDGCIDKELEQFRLEFFHAFEQWMDGMREMNLTPFIVTADRIISSNKDLLRWLRDQLEQEADYG